MAQRLTDMQISRVSLVDKGANQRRFAVLKREKETPMTGGLARIRKALHLGERSKVEKSAADRVATAGWALAYVLDLLELESTDAAADGSGGDGSDDASDVTTLRSAAQALSTYLTATAQEVGSADDLEDIAAEAAAYAAWSYDYGYDYWKRDKGAVEKGRKQFTADRLDRIKTAATQITSVLSEVDDITTTPTEGEIVNDAEIEKVAKRTAELLRATPEVPAAEPVEKGEDVPAWALSVIDAVGKVADRVEKLEKTAGQRTSLPEGDPKAVAKRAKFGGIF